MKEEVSPRLEDAIVDVIIDMLSKNHGSDYTFEGFIQDAIEIYAFAKDEESEKYCILRMGVNSLYRQVYISNIFMAPLLKYQGIGKKLIRVLFEIGQIYNYDVFVVQLTDSFKCRLLERGALETNEFDTLQIVESTNLLD